MMMTTTASDDNTGTNCTEAGASWPVAVCKTCWLVPAPFTWKKIRIDGVTRRILEKIKMRIRINCMASRIVILEKTNVRNSGYVGSTARGGRSTG